MFFKKLFSDTIVIGGEKYTIRLLENNYKISRNGKSYILYETETGWASETPLPINFINEAGKAIEHFIWMRAIK